MKIAVLMVGRIANFEQCYKSHYHNVFDNNEIDVYLAHNSNNITDNIELFKKIYKVKQVITLNVDVTEYEQYPIPLGIGVNGRNCVIMFKCLNEAFKMVKENQYDIVLYMRADEFITSKLNFSIPNENTIYIPFDGDYVGGINDQFAYGDYKSMKKYCSTIEYLHMFLSENRVLFHPENINRYNLEYNNLNIIRFPLKYKLFRPVASINILKILSKKITNKF